MYVLCRVYIRIFCTNKVHKVLVVTRLFAFIGICIASLHTNRKSWPCIAEVAFLPAGIAFARLFHCSSNIVVNQMMLQSKVLVTDNSGKTYAIINTSGE